MRNSTCLPVRTVVCLLAALVAAAGGCGTKVIGLKTDPSFTYESLSTGGIVVGGVTSLLDEVETAATGSQRASLLRLSILKERPDIDVQPAGAITQAIGQESYAALLDDYQLEGGLDAARLAQLSEALANLRYVIFGRIEDDVISRGTTVQRDTADDEDITIYRISRTVTTSLQIYDLTAGSPVWSGYIKKSKKKENRYVEYGNFGEGLIAAILGNKPEYPSTPEFSEVLRKTFEGFAEHLPKR